MQGGGDGSGGLGLILDSYADGTVKVDKLTANGAAERCGQVRRGDVLLAIDGVEVSADNLPDFKRRSATQTSYTTLRLKRDGNVFDVTVPLGGGDPSSQSEALTRLQQALRSLRADHADRLQQDLASSRNKHATRLQLELELSAARAEHHAALQEELQNLRTRHQQALEEEVAAAREAGRRRVEERLVASRAGSTARLEVQLEKLRADSAVKLQQQLEAERSRLASQLQSQVSATGSGSEPGPAANLNLFKFTP